MTTSLSIIIPTIGRPSLEVTLASLIPAGITDVDEVLVVVDGPRLLVDGALNPWDAAEAAGLPCVAKVIVLPSRAGDFGGACRTAGLSVATGQWATFMDDDDIYIPTALTAIRDAVDAYGHPALHLFRMMHTTSGIVWSGRQLQHGNIGTPCIVIPLRAGPPPVWGPEYNADFRFAEVCAGLWPVVWQDAVVARCRPGGTA